MPAGSLQVIQGAGQSAQLGQFYPASLVLRALDTIGNPMVGEPIIFSAPTTTTAPSGRFYIGAVGSTTHTTNSDSNGYVFIDNLRAEFAVGSWLGLAQFVNALSITRDWSMTNLAIAPASVLISQGTDLKAALNGAYDVLEAIVRDSGGNNLNGITVQFSVPAGHGTFPGGLTTVTAVSTSGRATAPTFTANATPGSFTVTVTVPSAPTVAAATTTWTNVDATIPTTLQAMSGGGQQTEISTQFTSVLRARVFNGLGIAMAGVSVSFTSPAAGASCTFPAIVTQLSTIVGVTNSNGDAVTPRPQANALTGTYFVVASVPGATSAQFQLTNGVAYFPEVCTTSAAPTGASQFGGGANSWVNPSQALTTSGSYVTIPTNAEGSQILFCSPIAVAALAAIADEAKITKFIATFELRGTRTSSYQPDITTTLYNGSVARSSGTLSGISTPTSFAAYTETFAAPFSGGANITGAQLKSGNFGIGFVTSGASGDATVRLVKLSVCYQNPNIPAGSTGQVSLLMCEA